MAERKEFAYLGSISFEILPVTGLDERYSYQYAEHQVIEGKPLLQYVADNLDETNLSIRFHFSFCDPAAEMKKLKEAGDKHAPLVLQFADGTLGGRFVITEISKTTEITADNGRALSLEVKVTLKEWYDPEPIKTRELQQKKEAPAVQAEEAATPAPAAASASVPADVAASNQRKAVAGGVSVSAKLVGALAPVIASLATGLSKVMSVAGPTIDAIKAAASTISAQVGPILDLTKQVADGVHEAAALQQEYISNIASQCSAVTRILSGLPGPAGKLGKRMEAVNNRISGEATRMMTMTSVVQGNATEAATRAQMITRMIPK